MEMSLNYNCSGIKQKELRTFVEQSEILFSKVVFISRKNVTDTFCTRLCENESNLKVIQSVMGHSDIQTTMDIYAECTQEKKDEVFANLNGKIMIK